MGGDLPGIRKLGGAAARALADDGRLEAVDGMLLFGISTAFIFALLQAFWSCCRRH